MRITISYATYSGGTTMAAQYIADLLNQKGHQATLLETESTTPEQLLQNDLIILSSPSYGDEEPPEAMKHFIKEINPKVFSGKQFAIFGLGDTSFPMFCGAVDLLEKFVQEQEARLIAPSLRIDGYFSNQTESETAMAVWAGKISDLLLQK